MPRCKKCGKWGLFLSLNDDGICLDCSYRDMLEAKKEEQKKADEEKHKAFLQQKEIDKMCANIRFDSAKQKYDVGKSISNKEHKQLLEDDYEYKTGYGDWYIKFQPEIKVPRSRRPRISNMSYDQLAKNLTNDIKYNTGFIDELDKYNTRQEEKKCKEQKKYDQIYKKYDTAHGLEKEGKFEEALSLYLEIVKKNPDGTAYFDRPCIVLEKLGRYDEAIALCNQALERISSGKMSADPESYHKRISRLEKKKSK